MKVNCATVFKLDNRKTKLADTFSLGDLHVLYDVNHKFGKPGDKSCWCDIMASRP